MNNVSKPNKALSSPATTSSHSAGQGTRRKLTLVVTFREKRKGYFVAQCERYPKCLGKGSSLETALEKVRTALERLLKGDPAYGESTYDIELLPVDLDKMDKVYAASPSAAEEEEEDISKEDWLKQNQPNPEPSRQASLDEVRLHKLKKITWEYIRNSDWMRPKKEESLESYLALAMAGPAKLHLSRLLFLAKQGNTEAIASTVVEMLALCDTVQEISQRFPDIVRVFARKRPSWPVCKSPFESFDQDAVLELSRLEVGAEFPLMAKSDIFKTPAGTAAWKIIEEIERHRASPVLGYFDNDQPDQWIREAHKLPPFSKSAFKEWWKVAQLYLTATYPKPGDLAAFMPTVRPKPQKWRKPKDRHSEDGYAKKAIYARFKSIAGIWATTPGSNPKGKPPLPLKHSTREDEASFQEDSPDDTDERLKQLKMNNPTGF